jgi:hypothetical protein
VKLARLRRPKITCSPSYADYRSKTSTKILLERPYMGGIGKGKETQDLNVADELAVPLQ